jgi:hypothetical protein
VALIVGNAASIERERDCNSTDCCRDGAEGMIFTSFRGQRPLRPSVDEETAWVVTFDSMAVDSVGGSGFHCSVWTPLEEVNSARGSGPVGSTVVDSIGCGSSAGGGGFHWRRCISFEAVGSIGVGGFCWSRWSPLEAVDSVGGSGLCLRRWI